jgi:hypothetical protein
MNMKRILNSLAAGALVAGVTFTSSGCGSGAQPSSDAQVTAAVRAAAKELSPTAAPEQAVKTFMDVLDELRTVPELAPLFESYRVPKPVAIQDDQRGAGLMELLGVVKITRDREGNVAITNRKTGGLIFSAPLTDLASGVFHPENLPAAVSPPTACTYTYSDWSACPPDGTQTRSVISSSPDGCTGTPILTQSCTYGQPPPATCESFTYSDWGACQADGTQTRTALTSSPEGCTGGKPVLSQPCTYTPPATCTSFTYSDWGACQSDGTQTRTALTSSPEGCAGGSPLLSQACTYTPPAIECTSFTYSDWSACQPDGTQTRTVIGASPDGCTGGTPIVQQACTVTPPIDGAALYGQYCASCHGALETSNLKGKGMTVQMIKDRSMTFGLSDAELQAIVTAVGP